MPYRDLDLRKILLISRTSTACTDSVGMALVGSLQCTRDFATTAWVVIACRCRRDPHARVTASHRLADSV